MAATATSQPILNGSTTRGGWGRTSEPGASFSGVGRGGRRGRGGRGGGRGGRPSRGGAAPSSKQASESTPLANVVPQATPAKATVSEDKKPAQPPQTPNPTETVKDSSPVASVTSSKGKGSSRRGAGRQNPVIPATAEATTTPDSVSPTSSRPPNRRQRSAQKNSNGSAPIIPKINAPPTVNETASSRTTKGRGRPTPLKESSAKVSTPLPSASQLETRHNIEAMVERVRASVLAGDNRPSTPGSQSYIDWAGDDDDTLPDLDDWVVKPAEQQKQLEDNMISPIIVDGLTPLPELVVKPGFQDHEGLSPSLASVYPPRTDTPVSEVAKAETSVEGRQAPLLHPSLPRKPVTASSGHLAHVNNSHGATPMRHNGLPKPPRSPVPLPSAELAKDSKPHSPQSNSVPDAEQGLEASIHAPKSALSDVPMFPSINNNFIYNPSGAPRPPQPALSAMTLHPRYAKSGGSTPRRGGWSHGGGRWESVASMPGRFEDRDGHVRTQSAPGHARSASRPVITGDAISRLARTINAVSVGGSTVKSD